jgi:hypothetical protein
MAGDQHWTSVLVYKPAEKITDYKCLFFSMIILCLGYAVAYLVEALCYKQEGRRLDSQ